MDLIPHKELPPPTLSPIRLNLSVLPYSATNSSYGQGLAQSVQKTLTEKGIRIAYSATLPDNQKKFPAIIDQLKNKKIDFVYYGGYHTELGLLIRQATKENVTPLFMGPKDIGNVNMPAMVGPASNRLLVTMPKNFEKEAANQHIVNNLKDKETNSRAPFIFPTL